MASAEETFPPHTVFRVTKMKMQRKEKWDDESDEFVTVDGANGRILKFIYSFLGISFGEEMTRRDKIFFGLFFFRISTVVADVVCHSLSDTRQTLVYFVVLTCFQLSPLVEFTYLFFRHRSFTREMNQYLARVGAKTLASDLFITDIRRNGALSCAAILIGFVLNASIGIASVRANGDWVMKRTFPFHSGPFTRTETVIALLVYMYEAYVKNYIALSTTLYLTYFNFLLHCKRLALRQIVSQSVEMSHRSLTSLDELVSSFENVLSFMPFLWLYYCIGPALILVFLVTIGASSATGNWLKGEDTCFLIYQTFNVFLTILTLFLLSRRQEIMNGQVDTVTDSMEQRASVISHFVLVQRIRKVLKRPVTAFLVFPIDRSLILAFIGSAITFTTLFIQLQG